MWLSFLIFPVCLILMFVLSTSQACSMVDMLITKLALHQLPCHQVQMMRKRMRRMRKQVGFSFTPVSCSLPTQVMFHISIPWNFFSCKIKRHSDVSYIKLTRNFSAVFSIVAKRSSTVVSRWLSFLILISGGLYS